MNNSIINIDGIHANSKTYNSSEQSTDTYTILTIRDEYGNAVDIIINNGKIAEAQWNTKK